MLFKQHGVEPSRIPKMLLNTKYFVNREQRIGLLALIVRSKNPQTNYEAVEKFNYKINNFYSLPL